MIEIILKFSFYFFKMKKKTVIIISFIFFEYLINKQLKLIIFMKNLHKKVKCIINDYFYILVYEIEYLYIIKTNIFLREKYVLLIPPPLFT